MLVSPIDAYTFQDSKSSGPVVHNQAGIQVEKGRCHVAALIVVAHCSHLSLPKGYRLVASEFACSGGETI